MVWVVPTWPSHVGSSVVAFAPFALGGNLVSFFAAGAEGGDFATDVPKCWTTWGASLEIELGAARSLALIHSSRTLRVPSFRGS